MRVVYLGDNRVRGNFGCRGTSTAFSQLIGEDCEIVAHISGERTNWNVENLVCIKGLPRWAYKFLVWLPGWRVRRKWMSQFHSWISKRRHKQFHNTKFDFANYDFVKARKDYINCLVANPEIKEFDIRRYDFDALVVNGEGSFIFGNPHLRETLVESMIINWALDMGKKVYFGNAMLSDSPSTPHNTELEKRVAEIFKRCEVIVTREHESYEYAKKYFPDSNITMIPDALFTWNHYINDSVKVTNGRYFMPHSCESDEFYNDFDFEKKYILIAGSSSELIWRDMQNTIDVYSKLTEKVKASFPEHSVYLIEVCEGDQFLNYVSKRTNTPIIPMDIPILAGAKILASADAFISGRYHPAVMASQGGTPCVFMASNSHKTRSLQELLEYDNVIEYSVIPQEEEQIQIIQQAQKKIDQGVALRERIKLRALQLDKEVRQAYHEIFIKQ